MPDRPPLVIPEDFAVITFHQTSLQADGTIANTLGVAVPSSNEALDTVNHAAFAWATHIMPILGSAIVFVGASMLIKRSDLLEHWDSNVNAPVAGASDADVNPLNSAVLIQKISAFAGKRNRGRMYLAGIPHTLTDVNTVRPATVVTWQAALDAFGTELKLDSVTFNAPMQPVILHHDAGAPTEITNFKVSNRLATQRGRLR